MEQLESHPETEQMVITGKQPWLGAFLNFFGLPGIGYFYSQNYLKGIVVLLLATTILTFGVFLMFSSQIPLVSLFMGVFFALLALDIIISVDVFKTIQKRNSADFEHLRKKQKDPWRAVFWNFIWPGLGHAYLRRWGWFIVISLFTRSYDTLLQKELFGCGQGRSPRLRRAIYRQLDALSTLPLQDNSGKSPDFLELLMGHQLRTGKGVGDSDCVVRDFEDSQTVVQKK